jgi:hypothetical protein
MPISGQRHGHRIDQERHVVVGDLHHRVRRLPAFGLQTRVEQLDAGLAALARAHEFQHVRGQFGPAFGTVLGELLGIHPLVEGSGEGTRFGQRRLRHPPGQRSQDRIEVVGGCRRVGGGLFLAHGRDRSKGRRPRKARPEHRCLSAGRFRCAR